MTVLVSEPAKGAITTDIIISDLGLEGDGCDGERGPGSGGVGGR